MCQGGGGEGGLNERGGGGGKYLMTFVYFKGGLIRGQWLLRHGGLNRGFSNRVNVDLLLYYKINVDL